MKCPMRRDPVTQEFGDCVETCMWRLRIESAECSSDGSMAGFDRKLFGKKIQELRKQAGFKSSEQFAEAAEACMDVKLSRDAVNRIEQGKQEPSLSQYLAICKTLFGTINPPEMHGVLFECVPFEWPVTRFYWACAIAVAARQYGEPVKELTE